LAVLQFVPAHHGTDEVRVVLGEIDGRILVTGGTGKGGRSEFDRWVGAGGAVKVEGDVIRFSAKDAPAYKGFAGALVQSDNPASQVFRLARWGGTDPDNRDYQHEGDPEQQTPGVHEAAHSRHRFWTSGAPR